MPKKNLIFITKQYPYYFQEQYITNELLSLSKVYDRIYVYPSDHYNPDYKIEYELPKNVEIIDLNFNPELRVGLNKFNKIMMFLRVFFYELIRTDSKWSMLREIKRYYSIFTTQYLQAMSLQNFLNVSQIGISSSTFYSYWFSNSALCLAILKQERVINHFYSKAHSIDLYHNAWPLITETVREPIFKFFKLKHVSILFPISQHGGAYLSKLFPSLKTKVSYLGVEDFGTNDLKSRDEKFLLVTCSVLDPVKRVELLGRALSKLDKRVKWIHFGWGDPLNEKLVLDSISSKNIEFELKGKTANREIREFYNTNNVDLFVNLSAAEGVPVSIMEAISHGIPALATAINGTPEVVIEGVSGKLIPVDFTNEQLVDAIRWFMDNPEEVNELRKGARKVFEEKYNAQKNHADFANYLSSLP